MADTNNEALRLLNSLDKYFRKVAESSKLFSKGISKKQKATITTGLQKELQSIDREFKELYDDTRKLSELSTKVNKKEVEELKKTNTEIKKQNRLRKDSKDTRIIPKSVLGTAKEFAKMQALWYPLKAMTFSFLAIPGNVLKSTAEYGDLLAQVSSVAGMTSNQLIKLDKVVKEVGTSTKFSMLEAAKATKILAQAGFRDDEITNALKPIALLATATTASISEATNLTSTVLRAYGKNASDFEDITDSLANAVVNSRLSLEDLNVAFGYVASAASQTGVTFNETIAILGTLANSGLKATTAATGLRMMLLKLAAPTKKANNVLESVGLSKDDLDASKVGIKNVIKELSKLSRTNIIDIFGARSANVVLSLLNTGEESIALLQKSIEASGTAARMAEEQLLSLKQSWKVLQDTIVQTDVGIGQSFSKDLAVDLRVLTGMIKDFNKVLPVSVKLMKGARVVFLGFATLLGSKAVLASIAALKAGFSSLLFSFQAMAGGAATFAESMAFLFPVLGTVTAAIIGVSTVTALLVDNWYNSKIATEEYSTSLKEVGVVIGKTTSATFKFRSELASLGNEKLPEDLFVVRLGNLGKTIKDDLRDRFNETLKLLKLSGKEKEEIKTVNDSWILEIAAAINKGDIKQVETALLLRDKALNKLYKESFKRQKKALGKKPVLDFGFWELGDEFTTPDTNVDTEKVLGDLNKVYKSIFEEGSKDIDLMLASSKKYTDKLKNAKDSLSKQTQQVSLPEFERLKQDLQFAKKGIEGIVKAAGGVVLSDSQKSELEALTKYYKNVNKVFKTVTVSVKDTEVLNILRESLAKSNKEYKKLEKEIRKQIKTEGLSIEEASVKLAKFREGALKSARESSTKTLSDKGLEGKYSTSELNEALVSMFEIKLTDHDLAIIGKSAEISRLKIDKTIIEKFIKAGKNTDEYKKQLAGVNTNLAKAQMDMFDLKEDLTGKTQFLEMQKADSALKESVTSKKKSLAAIKLIQGDIDNITLMRNFEQDKGNRTQVTYYNSQLEELYKQLLTSKRKFDEEYNQLDSEALKQRQKHDKLLMLQYSKTLNETKSFWSVFKNDIKNTITDGITSELDNMIEGTKSVSDAFKDMAENILKSLAKLAAASFMQKGIDGIFGSLNGIFGGGTEMYTSQSANPWVEMLTRSLVSVVASGISSMNFSGSSANISDMSGVGDDIVSISNQGSYYDSGLPTFRTSESTPKVSITYNGSASLSQLNVDSVEYDRDKIVSIVMSDLKSNGDISQTLSTQYTRG